MLSRPTRVYLAALSLSALVAIASVVTGIGTGSVVLLLLVFPIISLLLPQFYLAVSRGADPVSPRKRIRYGLLLPALLSLAYIPPGAAGDRLIPVAFASFLFGALVATEVRDGYRSSSLFAEDGVNEQRV